MRSACYPGSYVHVTPSFVYPRVVYVDADRKAKRFFADPRALAFISTHKTYPQPAEVVFYGQDYTDPFPEPEGSFDLLISLWAGFISEPCKRYLRPGGWLLVNNSHGDAGLAALDPDYQLIAVINQRQGKHRLSETNLDDYFIPKRDIQVSADDLRELGRGIGYTKTASLYLFRRIQ